MMPNPTRREREEAYINHVRMSGESAVGINLAESLQAAHRREDKLRDLIRLADAPDARYGNAGERAISTFALKRILDADDVRG
jgi:hypothetical protein